MRSDEKVVGVAIKSQHGWVISLDAPARHSDLISAMNSEGFKSQIAGEQGFVTSRGRFVNRYGALRIAVDAEQVNFGLLKRSGGELYSEDIW